MKKLLNEYNCASSVTNMSYVPHTLSSILSPDSEFWQSLSTNPTQVPWNTKREVISAFLLIKRSEEELNLLNAEMERVLQYYVQRKECIVHQLDIMKDEPQSLYTSGVMALLHKLLWEVELHHSKAVTVFTQINSSVHTASTSSDSDTSESESDSTSASDNESLL